MHQTSQHPMFSDMIQFIFFCNLKGHWMHLERNDLSGWSIKAPTIAKHISAVYHYNNTEAQHLLHTVCSTLWHRNIRYGNENKGKNQV